MKLRQRLIDLAFRSPFQGHINIGQRFTWYGFNAMWLMMEFHTKRWGYVCFRPPNFHPIQKWCLYCSPNGTPWAATFMIGNDKYGDKNKTIERRRRFGHNFNVRRNWRELCQINGFSAEDYP